MLRKKEVIFKYFGLLKTFPNKDLKKKLINSVTSFFLIILLQTLKNIIFKVI